MPKQWIIAADSSNARIFSRQNKNSPLEEVEDLANPSGRMKAGELESDKPGRSYDSGGEGRHAMEPEHTRKDKESIQFAEQISDYLSTHQQEFDNIIIICAPRFLGILRQALDKVISHKIIKEIDKDIVRMSEDDINKLILHDE